MAVARQNEHSVLSSLSELRAIEEQRVADERAAVEAAELARRQAIEAEQRAREEAAAKKVREAHEAQLAIENARVAAEREARMKIEAAEAQERNRQQAMLAEQRLAQEMELRREEVAKKRPTWMVVTTVIAMIAAFVLVYVAIDRTRAQEQANEQKRIAIAKQHEMKKQLEELQANVAGIERDLSALDATTDKLVKQLAEANNQAEREAIAKEIARNNEEKRKLRDRQRKVDEERRKIERTQEIRVNEKCQNNALC
jgi:hypothetical protein